MKNLKAVVCAALLVTSLSATTFAKTGTISTTKSGTISTTRTGTISTTSTGSITPLGTISTTRTGTISTTRVNFSTGMSGFQLLDFLFTFINVW
jgi:hypothetical protein